MSPFPEARESARLARSLDWLATFTDWEQLLHRAPRRATFDLGRMHRLLAEFDDPHRGTPTIHVTGTKGKSSVVCMTEVILRQHGLRTFRFLSPHVESVCERLAIDGSSVGAGAFSDLVDTLRPAVTAIQQRAPGDLPSFFEAITVMGFLLAKRTGVHVNVLEVGLGGRLDATNVVDPVVSLIGAIAKDHTRILGDTREAIAGEKAGIIKPGRPAATLVQKSDEAFGPLSAAADACGVTLVHPGKGLELTRATCHLRPDGGPGVRFDGAAGGLEMAGWTLRAGAPHQAWNAILAVYGASVALNGLDRRLDAVATRKALAELSLPARAEWFPGDPPVLLDGAHTRESVADLLKTARLVAGDRPLHTVCALTRDRDPAAVLGPLVEASHDVVATSLPTPRGLPAEEVRDALSGRDPEPGALAGPETALAAATAAARRTGGVIVIAGSLYLAGALRPALRARLGFRHERSRTDETAPGHP